MRFKILFIVVIMLFISTTVLAKDLSFINKQILKLDGMYYNDIKIQDNKDLTVWIDSYHLDNKGNRVYHVDSKEKRLVNRTLQFYYEIQPDYITQYSHKGEYVKTYTPNDWLWVPICENNENKIFPKCKGGYLTFESVNIDEGLGSTTYPINIDGATWSMNGAFAGYFDGNNDFVETTNTNLFNCHGSISVFAWIKPDSMYSDDGDIAMKYNPSGDNRAWLLRIANNNLRFSSTPDGLSGGLVSATGSSNIPSNSENWIFVGATFNGTTLQVYVNGTPDDTTPPETTCFYNSTVGIEIARSRASYMFNGSIDELRIYNRLLSESEILELYNSGRAANYSLSTNELSLWLNFDNSTIIDTFGNGHNISYYDISYVGVPTYETMTKGVDYTLYESVFAPAYSSYFNITYDLYASEEQYDSSVQDTESFFYLDLDERKNLYFLIIFFGIAITLLFFRQSTMSAFMMLIGGLLLMFSGIHLLIALVPIIAAIIIANNK